MIQQFTRNPLRNALIMLTCVGWLVLLAACGTTDGDTDNGADHEVDAESFVAEVDDDLFIGILVAPHPPEEVQQDVIVYLCDGAEVATWLFAQTSGDSVVLENDGTSVALSLDDEGVLGEVTRAGETHPFTADPATGEAGVHRAEKTIDGQDYVGGWIVLNNLEQRGAITLGGEVQENPTLDTTTGEAETSIGTFSTTVCFIHPVHGHRVCVQLQ